jgi:hypothetical protein
MKWPSSFELNLAELAGSAAVSGPPSIRLEPLVTSDKARGGAPQAHLSVMASMLHSAPAWSALSARFGRTSALLSVAYAAIGFSPIGALTLSIAGIIPLQVGGALLVGLAIFAALVLAGWFPTQHQLALEGYAAGLLAVIFYDLARWSTIAAGWWGDFIPAIGGWLLGTNQPDVLVGYLFRWLGDGGGMGLAFLVAARLLAPGLTRSSALWLGILYGVVIWACLLVTLLVAPRGQALMFTLTPATFILSLGGHLIYGSVLGTWLSLRPGSVTATVS